MPNNIPLAVPGAVQRSTINTIITTLNESPSPEEATAVAETVTQLTPANEGEEVVKGPSGLVSVISRVNAGAYSTLASALEEGAGSTVFIPPGTQQISTALAPAALTAIELHPNAIIEQTTKYRPVFDVLTNDVIIEGGQLQWNGSRAYTGGGAAFRGSDPYVYGAAIWSSGSRGRFVGQRAYGFTSAIFLNNWNGSALSGYAADNVVQNVLVEEVDFGILFVGQDRLVLDDLRGSYSLQSGSPNPPHLVYAADTNGSVSRDLIVGKLYAYDGLDSYAYQFKAVSSGSIGTLTARNCAGVLSLATVSNVTLDQVTSNDDVSVNDNGSIYFQTDTDTGVKIKQATLDMAVERRAVRLTGVGNEIGSLKVTTIRSTADSSKQDVVIAGGSGNKLPALTVLNTGAGAVTAVNISGGTGHRVGVEDITNCFYGVEVNSGRTGCIVSYDPQRITTTAGISAANRKVRLGEATTTVRLQGRDKLVTTVASGTIASNVWRATSLTDIQLTVNDSTAFAIPAPFEPYPQGELTFEIVNNTAGALGTVTWNAIYDLRTTWTSPAAGGRTFITFRYDQPSAKWREVR